MKVKSGGGEFLKQFYLLRRSIKNERNTFIVLAADDGGEDLIVSRFVWSSIVLFDMAGGWMWRVGGLGRILLLYGDQSNTFVMRFEVLFHS